MLSVCALVIGVLITKSAVVLGSKCEGLLVPPTLKLGAATSAYQVEGGWNASDKGETAWDRKLHEFPQLFQGNADVACDSYHLWQRDLEMCERLGLEMYRFSISWSRLLPNGFSNIVSEDGTRYYNNLIDGLLAKGIEPVVTLHHFDIPQRFQDLGGWANPLIADWFGDYARVAFRLFGDRVKYWLTINEPIIQCDVGYDNMTTPFIKDTDYGVYLCNKHVLLAHAKAYRVYDKEFRAQFNGKVSIVTLFMWLQPKTANDTEITELAIEFAAGRYEHPIYSKEGGWPKKIEAFLAQKSKAENYTTSRLPAFTDEEKELIKGSYDFYGLNHYTTRLVRKALPGEAIGRWPAYGSEELGIVLEADSNWTPIGDMTWFTSNPKGLREQLNYLNKKYKDVKEFMISENGFYNKDASLHEARSIVYLKGYLEQTILAIQDGVNVSGYLTWSLMDTFEAGYLLKFGLYHVDFQSVNRTRTIRDFGYYYANVTRSRCTQAGNFTVNNLIDLRV